MAGEYRWHLVPESLEQRRAALIAALGGVCERCKSTEDLDVHHKYGKSWRSNELSRFQRLARYEQDAREGLVILLCKDCHEQPVEHPDDCFCPFCRGDDWC